MCSKKNVKKHILFPKWVEQDGVMNPMEKKKKKTGLTQNPS